MTQTKKCHAKWFVFYSTGNFVFNQLIKQSLTNILANTSSLLTNLCKVVKSDQHRTNLMYSLSANLHKESFYCTESLYISSLTHYMYFPDIFIATVFIGPLFICLFFELNFFYLIKQNVPLKL